MKRVKSKSLTTAILMILALSGTTITAISSLVTDLVYAQQQARINVIMRVVCNPPTPNCPSPSQFRIGVQGNDPNPSQFSGSSMGTIVTVDPGFVAVNVIGQPASPPGYTLNPNSLQGCSGQATPGTLTPCVITATYESANINVAMRVVCNPPTPNCPSPSQFRIGVQGNNPNPSQFQGSSAGTNVMIGPGNYDINVVGQLPPAPPGYTLTGNREGCTDTISAGQSFRCIITATYLPATLRVIKEVTCPPGTSNCPQPSAFRIQVTGNPAIPNSFQGSSAGTDVLLGVGKFSVTEGVPPSISSIPNPPGLALAPIFSNGCSGVITRAGQQLPNCIITNRYLPDADGDGIANTWETNGIDINIDGTVDLRLPGANANHKNLYIEVDYMQFHQPIGQAITNVINAFNNPTVSNPDNVRGIILNVQTDEQIPHRDKINGVPGLLEIKRDWFGTATERASSNSYNILTAKAFTYHYGPFVHDRSDIPGSSGVSNGSPGMEFFASLGAEGYPQDPATKHAIGSRDQQEGTFMHELGHNLGLSHGGDPTDGNNCEPNYLSIMSYSFQFSDWVSNRPLDFSRSQLPTLDKELLDESKGIGQSTPPRLTTVYNGPSDPYKGPRYPAAGSSTDFNFNGKIDREPVFSDINGRLACNTPGEGATLTGFNDWNNIKYISTPAILPAPPSTFITSDTEPTLQDQQLREAPEEQTINDVRESRLILLDGIDNAIQRLIDSVGAGVASAPVGGFDTSHIAKLLQTDQLDAAIKELVELKRQVIKIFGEVAAKKEVVPQINNLVGALEQQMYPTPPPASGCLGSGSRNSKITGTPDPDTLIGSSGQNIMNGLGGGDRISGCGANDRINGGPGNDGAAGGPQNDDLNGNEGDDVMQGDSGNDRLAGGSGLNFLTGGSGRDTFICDPQGETHITDFVPRTDTFSGPCIIADATSSLATKGLSTAPLTTLAPSSMPVHILPMPLPD